MINLAYRLALLKLKVSIFQDLLGVFGIFLATPPYIKLRTHHYSVDAVQRQIVGGITRKSLGNSKRI